MQLAKRVQNINPSLTLAFTAKAKKLKSQGIDVVSFCAGEPDFDTPDNIKDAAKKAIDSGFTKYTPASGALELKEAISAKLKEDNGLIYGTDSISVSCGAKHSLYNIFQAICEEGDEVIIPAPYWLSYPEMVGLSGARPVFISTIAKDGFKISPGSLKERINKQTKALVINSPSNPTGSVYSPKELAAIAKIAATTGIIVISDEIYEYLTYDNLEHASIASQGEQIKKLTLVVNGVSKGYSMTGWRIGYVAGPQDIISAINKIQSHSTSNPASISQKAALEAIKGDRSSILKMRAEFAARRDYMIKRLEGIDGFDAYRPNGAFYIFCDISKTGLGSVELANKLIDDINVAVIPGKPFGSDSHIRLSFAAGMDDIVKGMDRIDRWVKARQ